MGIKHTASAGLSRSKKSDYSWTWDSEDSHDPDRDPGIEV